MKLSAAVVIVLGMALCGCATVIDGSSERIAIATSPVTGARCVLSNGRGHWTVTTPGTVNVERSKHDMDVRCSKPGYQDVKGTIASDMDGWTLVNFAFVDLPGLGVDAWTGAINDYSDTNHFGMEQSGGAEPAYSAPSYSNPVPDYSQPAPSYSEPAPAYFPQTPNVPDSSQPSPGTLPPEGY